LKLGSGVRISLPLPILEKLMPRYESHITVDKQHAKEVENIGNLYGMKFSVIAGCPLLGSGTYCYLTHYDGESAERLRDKVLEVDAHLMAAGIKPLRLKIEQIIWDTKTGVNEIDPKVTGEVRFVE
jgi:hypothetical protein